MFPTIIMALTILCFAVGVVGSFLPMIPGGAMVFVGVLVHKLALDEASVSWGFVILAASLAVASPVLDYACSYWGARRFGASWQGAAGAVVGAVIGIAFFGIPGLIAGPVAGAVLVELVKDWSWRRAGRAGFGTIVGGIAAFILKLLIVGGIIAGFFWALP